MQSCCSLIASACPPIASASAAARRLRPLRISCCSLARLHPLHLLLPVCVRFQLLLPDCARFSCCCMLAACICFSCCSRSRPLRLLLPDIAIASASTASPRIRLQPQLDSSPMFSNILRGVRGSVNRLKYENHASL